MKEAEQHSQALRKVTRRRFLEKGTMAAVSTGALLCLTGAAQAQSHERGADRPSAGGRKTAKPRRTEAFEFTRASFAPCLGQSFRVVSAAVSPVYLTLDRINDLPATKPATAGAITRQDEALARDLSFMLVFRGFAHESLGQQTVQLEHSSTGRLLLLIVPVGGNDAWSYYEAVFNRSNPE